MKITREIANAGNKHGTQDKRINPGRAWFSIIIIVLLVIFSMIDRNAVNLMIDPIRRSFGINDFQISLLQGPAFALFFLLGSLLMGWLVDRYSNRWLIYTGVTIWSMATIASGFSTSFATLLAARCVVGLGESVLQPAGWHIVTRLFPAHRLATAIGTLTAGSQLGVAASFLLTGFLVAEAGNASLTTLPLVGHLQSWQWVFIAAGLPGLFLAALIFILPADKKQEKVSGERSGNGLIAFMRDNRAFLACHFLGFGLLSIMVHGSAAWGPTYLIRTHGMEIRHIGLLLGFLGVPLGVGGVIFAGWLVDRSFRLGQHDAHLRHFAIRAIAVAVLGGIGFTFDATLLVPLACFVLIQFIQPFSGVAGASLQVSIPEVYRGRISAIFIMFYNALGMMLGPSFVALLSNSFGPGKLGIAIAVNYIVLGAGAAVLLWAGRRHAAKSYRDHGLRAVL